MLLSPTRRTTTLAAVYIEKLFLIISFLLDFVFPRLSESKPLV